MRAPQKMGTTEWAERYRGMSAKSTALPGRYSAAITPWIRGMHEALDDPSVTKVVAQKSAQVAWTDGVLLNYIGRRIDIDPCPMIVMFAKDKSVHDFNDEKLVPMIEATPRLAAKIPVASRRDKDNRFDYKGFPGGFLKLVGSNSPASVKSTAAPVVCVEEPDDCNTNVKDQGDTITLLIERTKTFSRSKVIYGGTPTVEGFSAVEQAYKASDKRKFFIPCPDCGEEHVLSWDNVHWQEDPEQRHAIYGNAVLDSVVYVCPHCGSVWDDTKKNRAVRHGVWRATEKFIGVAGFYINELYSPFPGSKLKNLLIKYLTAKSALDRGDDTKMRSFFNSQLGLPYAFESGLPDPNVLAERAEDYEELTVPVLGCVLTVGVDVQHDRLAVIIRAWGPGEESWLVYWGEIYGETITPEQGAWKDLDALLSKGLLTPQGAKIYVQAGSIDSSDGQTSDAVYAFVRKRKLRGLMAIKGSSVNDSSKEIFTAPKVSVDLNRRQKASKFGLRPFIVGTSRAKDLILGVDANAGRVKLEGDGPGRMHWYKGVRPDYWEQLTSEVKAPSSHSSKRVWQKKSGVRNEALDCEVYALHAARSLKLHLWPSSRWDAEKEKQVQMDLIEDVNEVGIESDAQQQEDFDDFDDSDAVEQRDDFYDAFERRSDGW